MTDPEGYALYEGPVTGDTIELERIQPWSHKTSVLYHAEVFSRGRKTDGRRIVYGES